MKKTAISALIVVAVGFILWLVFAGYSNTDDGETPAQSGETTYFNASEDNIKVTLPFPGAVVSHEFTVRGEARGPWFFEASFPVYVADTAGNELAVGIATAEGEWMTEDYVPFSAPVTVPSGFSGEAILILVRDNPSGLPENDAYASFPISVSE